MSTSNPPKALLTDVFGTVVDWRSTVTNHLIKTAEETLNSPSSSLPSTVRTAASSTDWPAFAAQWRASYGKFTSTFDPQKDAFKTVDQHHLESLISLLREYGLDGLWSEDELQKISMIWHFLDPWADSSHGLEMLNQKFETATLSNGNVSLLNDLAEYAKLPYKHIISSADFGAYKPHPNVYNGAAKKVGFEPGQCALVAAHMGDCEAAKKKCGFQAIYIERKGEEGYSAEEIERVKKEGWVDMWIGVDEGGFEEVARRFGCTSPQKGVYHETGSITGDASHKSGTGKTETLEEQAKQGIYHEDASIIDS